MKHKEKIEIMRATMDDHHTISIFFTCQISYKTGNMISFFSEDRIADFSIKKVYDNCVIINVARLDIKKLYYIGYETNKVEVIPHKVLDLPCYNYDGDDLGLSYSRDKTSFRIFAPTATSIKLNLYDSLENGNKKQFDMEESIKGTWFLSIKGNHKYKFYSFIVNGNHAMFKESDEVVDPYAPCVIAKHKKAMIIDSKDYKKRYNSPELKSKSDAVIYEIHTRDMTINESSGVVKKGKYEGLCEEKTFLHGNKESGISTSVNHIKELGVSVVQILPVQDFDNSESDPDEYGWGYMPRFFNSPDGVYSSDYKNDSKIKEVIDFVDIYHKNNLKVILDVVYNHTAEGFWGEGVFSFNAFVPYFYYRFGNGHISNGSGCGNEFRSESFMGRKFIIDSLKYWTEFYGFDGFRFDLMGLIDLETMTEAVSELKKVKEDILVYGEPWTGGLTPIEPTYKGAQRFRGFSVFNDEFRDAIKGPVFDNQECGFVQNGSHHNKVMEGIIGSINIFASSPVETLNYVEVHDNNTLFDKLLFSLGKTNDFFHPDGELLDRIKAVHKLTAFILLTSQGLPVLHLGQDFCRTKQGVENSYNSPDEINAIDWQRKSDFFDVFHYYKSLINIRKRVKLLHLDTEHEIREAIEFKFHSFPIDYNKGIAYILDGKGKFDNKYNKLFVLINPYEFPVEVDLFEEGWKKLLEYDNVFIGHEDYCGVKYSVPAVSGVILYK